jgi:type IV pilus assembly protein PilC
MAERKKEGIDKISDDIFKEKNGGQPKAVSFLEKINSFILKLQRVPLKEKLFFVQNLSIMLKAGVPLSSSLITLAKQTDNKYFRLILKQISKEVEQGISFAASLKKQQKIFGELFIHMIEAGEVSGKLEEVLGQLHTQLKKQYELMSKVKGAMTYPAVIILAMGGIGTFMMIYVVPKITAMFKELNAELPLPTKIIIGLSDFIAAHGILVGLTLIAIIALLIKILRTRKGKYIFEILLLNTPIIAPIIKKINLAGFARTISSLLKTDIMIIKTFQITGSVLGNLHYREALLEMAEKIKKGGQINEVVSNYPKLFSPIVCQMIAVGEQTGELDNILEELALFYESEVDQTMTNLPSIIEPILILILGISVGLIAVAIVMPMYSITQAI